VNIRRKDAKNAKDIEAMKHNQVFLCVLRAFAAGFIE